MRIGDLLRALPKAELHLHIEGAVPIFGQTLTEELGRLTGALGFSARDLARLQENAFAVARLTAVERARALDEIRALVAASEGART